MTVILILLILILIYFLYKKKEKFTNNISNENKNKIVHEIINNLDKFNNQNLDILKKEYEWIDPIIYEDIKQSLRNKHLNIESLTNKIFK